MDERDRLAFMKFCFEWDTFPESPRKYVLGKWLKYFVNSEHNDPHDAPMTCDRCVVDECYAFADKLLSITSGELDADELLKLIK